jgi:UDP-MurNAc hydroxylase
VFVKHLATLDVATPHLVIPGSILTLEGATCSVQHPVPDADVDAIFTDKRAYLETYQTDMADRLAAERESWPTRRTDVVAELKDWFEPLLAGAPLTRAGVGQRVLIETEDAAAVIDFPAGTVTEWDGDERVPFAFTIPRPLLESLIERHIEEWSNELFLSCRFSARRDLPYNEYLYTFFKSLSPERIAYAESYYSLEPGDEDVEWITLDGYVIERYCPHQRSDLSKLAAICDGVLTCAVHGWQYDAESGECLTSETVKLRTRGKA